MPRISPEFENTNIKGSWIGIFQQKADNHTILDFTEEIKTNNILMQVLAKPYLKGMQKKYIKDLEKVLKENEDDK